MGKSEAGRSQKEGLANSRSQEHMTLSGGMGLGGGKHPERCEGTGRVGSYLNMRAAEEERGVRGCCHLRCPCLVDRGTSNRNGKSRSRCRLVGRRKSLLGGRGVYMGCPSSGSSAGLGVSVGVRLRLLDLSQFSRMPSHRSCFGLGCSLLNCNI